MSQSPTDDRIRLALVITELEPGGAERCLTNLALGLDRNRFAPAVYSLGPRPDADRAQLVERLESAGVPVRFVRVTKPWQFFSARRDLARLLAEQSPDVVQTFLYHANVVGTMAARRAGVARVVTNIRVADPSLLRQRFERFVTRRVSKVVCVSQSVAQYVCEKMGFEQDRLAVISNGIDVADYPAKEAADLTQFGIAQGRKVIVCVARFVEQKNIPWLLNVAPRLFQNLPNHDLLLVGDGPLLAGLKDWHRDEPRIHFAGWRPDVKEILRACVMLVLTSAWEGMPNVILEAMATGLPVVTTQVSGVEELLGPLGKEQSFPLHDSGEFQSRVMDIARNEDLANNLGKQNRERAQQHFSLSAMVDAYERLHESLVRWPSP